MSDDSIWPAVFFGAFAGFILGMIVGSLFEGGTYKFEAIERGYALYCPADGAWAWVGECEK
jgi:hypothetical protein